MRSLAIKSSDGFVLVCAANDAASLEVLYRPHIDEILGSIPPCGSLRTSSCLNNKPRDNKSPYISIAKKRPTRYGHEDLLAILDPSFFHENPEREEMERRDEREEESTHHHPQPGEANNRPFCLHVAFLIIKLPSSLIRQDEHSKLISPLFHPAVYGKLIIMHGAPYSYSPRLFFSSSSPSSLSSDFNL